MDRILKGYMWVNYWSGGSRYGSLLFLYSILIDSLNWRGGGVILHAIYSVYINICPVLGTPTPVRTRRTMFIVRHRPFNDGMVEGW